MVWVYRSYLKKVINKDLDDSQRKRFKMSTFSDTKLKEVKELHKEEKSINFLTLGSEYFCRAPSFGTKRFILVCKQEGRVDEKSFF